MHSSNKVRVERQWSLKSEQITTTICIWRFNYFKVGLFSETSPGKFSFVQVLQSSFFFCFCFFCLTNRYCSNSTNAFMQVRNIKALHDKVGPSFSFSPALLTRPDMCSAWWYNYQTKMPQPLLLSLFHQLADRRSGDNLFAVAASTQWNVFAPPISLKPSLAACLTFRIHPHLQWPLKLFHALHSHIALLARQSRRRCQFPGCATVTGINRVSLNQPKMSCKAKTDDWNFTCPLVFGIWMCSVRRKAALCKMSVLLWVDLHEDEA